MDRSALKEWLLKEPESALLDEAEQEHVVDCLQQIVEWYGGYRIYGRQTDGFVEALLENDFRAVCDYADKTNRKVLSLYAKFIYCCLPTSYISEGKYIRR